MPDKTLKEKVDAIRKRIRTSKYYAERERSHYQLETWRQTEEALTALEERVEELEKTLKEERIGIARLMAIKRENRKLQQEIKYLRKEAQDAE